MSLTAEPEAEPEPEYTYAPEPEPKSEPEGWPEPGPDWRVSFDEWGPAWECHVYIYATIFALLDILTILLILNNRCQDRSLKQGRLTISLLIMMTVFNSLRAISLFTDPYSTVGSMPSIISRLIWSVPLPFLSSAFSLVLLVLLDTTRMDIGKPKFQNLSVIIGFTIVHFVIVVVTDLVVFYKPETKGLLLFCQLLFILYGTILTVGYFYVGWKIRCNCAAGQLSELSNVIRLCFISSFVGISIAVTHLYASAGEFGVYSDVIYVDSWSWWSLQTVMRLEEIAEASIVVIVATPSMRPLRLLKNLFVNKCWFRKSRVIPISIKNSTAKVSIGQYNEFENTYDSYV